MVAIPATVCGEKVLEWQKPALEFLNLADNALGRVSYHRFIHGTLGYDFPEIWDPRVQQHIHRIGDDLDYWFKTRHLQGSYRKIMDIRPRGAAKSATGTTPMPEYVHLRDSEVACGIMSANTQMSRKFSTGMKAVWEGDDPRSQLVGLFGDFKPESTRERTWTREEMVTARRKNLAHLDATMKSFSMRSGPTSGHFKLFVIDDPITEEEMEKDREWLEKVWAAYKRMDFVVDKDGLLYLIMTRYHEADLIGRIIREEIEPEVRARVQMGAPEGKLPADFDYKEGWIKYAHLAGWTVYYDGVYEDYDEKTKTGRNVYPCVWPDPRISSVRRTERGEINFHFQLENLPTKREDAPVRQEHIDQLWIESLDDVPKRALRNCVILCDFAFKSQENAKKGRGDWGVAHVVAIDDGMVYRLGGIREKMKQKEFGQQLIHLIYWVQEQLNGRVRKLTFELQIGHGEDDSTRFWLQSILREHKDIPRIVISPINRTKGKQQSKWDRIRDTAWAWQQGNVVLIEEAENNDPLIYQMLNIGNAPHDDDADAFADAFHAKVYKKASREAPDFDEAVDENQWMPRPAVHGKLNRRTGSYEFTQPTRRVRNGNKERVW